MSKKNSKERIQARREEAIKRQELRDQLTPEQQLQRLDLLLGNGVGAKRERARLLKQIEESKE